MKFSLMFFSSGEGESAQVSYGRLRDFARFADVNGLERVWLPERHFVSLGALHPNPAVLAAALAVDTQRVRIAAGSVVAPLHDPLRIAEEWSMVDNLSGGRVDLALASGWRAEDFALAPSAYRERHEILEQRAKAVRTLWQGGSLERIDGRARSQWVSALPHPVQGQLPLWITAARNPQTFDLAGRLGASLLTYLVDLGFDGLANNLGVYRTARQRAGHDPRGWVTVMLHSFIGTDPRAVRSRIEPAYWRYVVDNHYLLNGTAGHTPLNQDDAAALAREQFERVYEKLSLMGSFERCRSVVNRLRGLGVDEIACLVDFVDFDMAFEGLPGVLALANSFAVPESVEPTTRPSPPQPSHLASPCVVADRTQFYDYIESLGGYYGPAFQWIQEIESNEVEARAVLALPEQVDPMALRALLIDAAVSTAHAIGMVPGLRGSERPLGLPVGVGRISFTQAYAQEYESKVSYNVRTRRRSGFSDIMEFDIDVKTADGNPAIQLEGVRFQRLPRLSDTATDEQTSMLIHTACWTTDIAASAHTNELNDGGDRRDGLPLVSAVSTVRRRVLRCHTAVAEVPLVQTLAELGHQVHRIRAGQSLQPEDQNPDAVIDVWIGDLEESIWAPPAEVELYSIEKAVHDVGVQVVACAEVWRKSMRSSALVFIVRGANLVTSLDRYVDPVASAAWAAAASVIAGAALSCMNTKILLIDLDVNTPAVDQARLVAELLEGGDAGCVALRNGACWRLDEVQTLRTNFLPVQERTDIGHGDRVLITGGAGGLGRSLVGWLVAQGAEQIRVVSRRAHRADKWLELLRQCNSNLTLQWVDADIATPDGARAAVGASPQNTQAWDTVFHLAGDDYHLQSEDDPSSIFARCLHPKLSGLLRLCEAWANRPPRQLVLFCSTAALAGSAGQAAYATANAALAAVARSHPTLRNVDVRILWFGPWQGSGMASAPYLQPILAAKGVAPMAEWRALRAMQQVLASSNREAIIALRGDIGVRVPGRSVGENALEQQIVATAEENAPVDAGESRQRLLTAIRSSQDEIERQSLIRIEVLNAIGIIMELPPSSLNPQSNLYELGFDSLMAIELKNLVLHEYGVQMSLANMLDAATIEQIVSVLLPRLLEQADITIAPRSCVTEPQVIRHELLL